MPMDRDYQQAIEQLFALRRFGIRPGLERIRQVLARLGNPERRLRAIHITGTNGKGSTAQMTASILQRAGMRPGLYTSPHLHDFAERIRIAGQKIPHRQVVRYTRQLLDLARADNLPLTFFESATAMFFMHCVDSGADPVVIETGLGGRLDATSVVQPLVAVLTSIGHDHTKFLGSTLASICDEKTAIIKQGCRVVSSVSQPRLQQRIAAHCHTLQAPLVQLGRQARTRSLSDSEFHYTGPRYQFASVICALQGRHQHRNAAAAIATVEALAAYGIQVDAAHILAAIATCHVPGRFETMGGAPPVIFDGAHNPPAWRCLADTLRRLHGSIPIVFLLSVMADKNIARLISLLAPMSTAMVFFQPDAPRAADHALISTIAAACAPECAYRFEPSAEAAFAAARACTPPGGLVCVTGSLYGVAAVRELVVTPEDIASGPIDM